MHLYCWAVCILNLVSISIWQFFFSPAANIKLMRLFDVSNFSVLSIFACIVKNESVFVGLFDPNVGRTTQGADSGGFPLLAWRECFFQTFIRRCCGSWINDSKLSRQYCYSSFRCSSQLHATCNVLYVYAKLFRKVTLLTLLACQINAELVGCLNSRINPLCLGNYRTLLNMRLGLFSYSTFVFFSVFGVYDVMLLV